MARKKANKKVDQKIFRTTAQKTKAVNVYTISRRTGERM